jgi:hypothetical protein
MPDSPARAVRQAAPSRDRTIQARRRVREEKTARDRRVIDLLNRGVSVAEIAGQSGVSVKRMRNLVREILAERMPEPPAEYLALQVGRLNEALIVSYGSMYDSTKGANFEAIDRVIRIVRELDRYHGFGAAPRPREEGEPRWLPPPAETPIAIPIAVAERVENGAASD